MGATIESDYYGRDSQRVKLDYGPDCDRLEKERHEFRDEVKTKALLERFRLRRESGADLGTSFDEIFGDRYCAYPTELFPARLILTKEARIPDFFIRKGLVLVSQAFKDLVESFDPGTNQFVPVTIELADGSSYPHGSHYFFNCTRLLDTLDVSDLERSQKPGAIPEQWCAVRLGTGKGLRAFKEKIGHVGFWDELLAGPDYYVSDSFLKELKARKLTGWEVKYPFAEI